MRNADPDPAAVGELLEPVDPLLHAANINRAASPMTPLIRLMDSVLLRLWVMWCLALTIVIRPPSPGQADALSMSGLPPTLRPAPAVHRSPYMGSQLRT